MRFPTFLFNLVERFVPMPKDELADLKADTKKYYYDVQYSDEYLNENPEKKNDITTKVKKFLEHPLARLGLAVSYIFIYRYIFDFMNDEANKDEEKDDSIF